MQLALMPKQKSGVLAQILADEILVYDASHNVAHALNPTASIVWTCCDGVTPFRQVEEKLAAHLGVNETHSILLESLRILSQKSLLEAAHSAMPRRQLLKRLGLAAALLPVVISAPAPSPAAAVSCGNNGAPCTNPGSQDTCCPGFFCNASLGGGICGAT